MESSCLPILELTTTPVLAVLFGRFDCERQCVYVAEAGLELTAVLGPLSPSEQHDRCSKHACSITIISTSGSASPEPKATLTSPPVLLAPLPRMQLDTQQVPSTQQ